MKAITLKALAILICAFFLSSCDNSTGPTLVNNNGNNNGNQAPAAPNSPSPADSSVNQSNNVTLSWHCTDPNAGDTLKYDVYISNSPVPTLLTSNLVNPSYGIGIVDHNTTFYWKVVAKDNHGASTNSPIWRFKTAP